MNKTFKELLEQLADQDARWSEAITALAQRDGAVASELVEQLGQAFETPNESPVLLPPTAIRI